MAIKKVDSATESAAKVGRANVISVRVTDEEIAWVDMHRASLKVSRSTLVRLAAMNRIPRCVPPINQAAWALLVGATESIQRIADRMDQLTEFDMLALELKNFATEFRAVREMLIGQQERVNRIPKDEPNV